MRGWPCKTAGFVNRSTQLDRSFPIYNFRTGEYTSLLPCIQTSVIQKHLPRAVARDQEPVPGNTGHQGKCKHPVWDARELLTLCRTNFLIWDLASFGFFHTWIWMACALYFTGGGPVYLSHAGSDTWRTHQYDRDCGYYACRGVCFSWSNLFSGAGCEMTSA